MKKPQDDLLKISNKVYSIIEQIQELQDLTQESAAGCEFISDEQEFDYDELLCYLIDTLKDCETDLWNVFYSSEENSPFVVACGNVNLDKSNCLLKKL